LPLRLALWHHHLPMAASKEAFCWKEVAKAYVKDKALFQATAEATVHRSD